MREGDDGMASKRSVKKLAAKIRKLCEARGWSQADLKRATGLTDASLSRYQGGSVPGIDAGLKVARALGVPLEYLADDAADEPPPPESEDWRVIRRLVDGMGAEEAIRRLSYARGVFTPPTRDDPPAPAGEPRAPGKRPSPPR